LTTYEVLLSTTAAKEFKSLQKMEQNRIREKLNDLAKDPYNNSQRLDTKKLTGTSRIYYRLRVGDYRVICFLDDDGIKVVRIATRSDAYSWLD
jgi:mRNA interferase RelE/StbE